MLISQKKRLPPPPTKYWVFVRSDDFGKANLNFYSYEEAKTIYDKIKKSGKVKYQDIIDNSDFEREFYEKGVEEGWTKEGQGHNSPADISSVSEISFGKGEEVFEEKQF